MGFTGLVVVFSIIGQIYDIDLKINSIVQRKMALNRAAEIIGVYRSRAISAAPKSMVRFKAINFSGHYRGGYVVESSRRFVNPANPNMIGRIDLGGGNSRQIDISIDDIDANNAFPFSVVRPVPDNAGNPVLMPAGQEANIDDANPGAGKLPAGEVWMKKEEAEALYEMYLKKISAIEKELDMQLEALRSKRTALVSQKDEFQKYIAEGIKMTFKNAYA